MDFNYSPEDESFRKEVRDWLTDNLPSEWTLPQLIHLGEDQRFKISLDWQNKLSKRGWVGVTWPKKYGGGGGSLMQQVVLSEELAKAKAPELASRNAIAVIGPTILKYGTEEQKKRFLPKLLSGEECWCQGFSEPDAGSDLANLSTCAVVNGDDYTIDGQKVWSSRAQYADLCYLMVRTDPQALSKHHGITMLLIDMKTPGIEVRPLPQINGNSEFNEIFFDKVRVPRTTVLGEENRGWYVAMTALSFERVDPSRPIVLQQVLDEIIKLAREVKRNGKPAIEDPALRQKLARCAIESKIVWLNTYRELSTIISKGEPGPEASFSKVFWTELFARMTELGTQILGLDSLIINNKELNLWAYDFLSAKGALIAMGSSEIVRNVVGERVLGLPR